MSAQRSFDVMKLRASAIGALAFAMLLPIILSSTHVQAQARTSFQSLYSFTGGADGADPFAALIADAGGNLYGTAGNGGDFACTNGCGVVFKLDNNGSETVLHSFSGADGEYPSAGLIGDTAGNLYGTTYSGGAFNLGTVFKLDNAGNETLLYSFRGGADGIGPVAGLVRDAAGNLYGTTLFGGAFSLGTVFKLDKNANETVLCSFKGGADGYYPYAGLTADAAGNLYGTTAGGGAFHMGTVFKLEKNGHQTVLHSFSGADGENPSAVLLADSAGNLYGSTGYGGAYGGGTVFKLDKTGNETVLYSFNGGADGGNPYAGLIGDAAGNLYGTTVYGGDFACTNGCGVVFKLDNNGDETVLHSFSGADGEFPFAGLIRDRAGNLYGTTSFGADSNAGTVFKLIPSNPR